MTKGTSALLYVLLAAAALPCVAQSVETAPPRIITAEDAARDKSHDEPYDTPELFGAQKLDVGKGGRLPSILAEYTVRSGKVFQRVSVFDNGVVSLHIRGVGPDMKRQLVMPPETLDTVRTLIGRVDAGTLAAAASRMHDRGTDYAQLRFRRDASVYELMFGSSEAIPQSVTSLREMLGELLALIADDHQVANPVSTHTAAVGDRLVSDDGEVYRVTRIVTDGDIVELENSQNTMRLFIPANMLYKIFNSVRETAADAQ